MSIDPPAMQQRTLPTVEGRTRLLRRLASMDAGTPPAVVLESARAAVDADLLGRARPSLQRLLTDPRSTLPQHLRADVEGLLLLDRVMSGQWGRIGPAPGPVAASHEAAVAEGLVSACRGDSPRARAVATRILARATARGDRAAADDAHRLLAVIAASAGRFATVFAEAASISPPGSLTSNRVAALQVPLELVEGAVRTGRRADAEAHVSALEMRGVDQVSPRLRLIVLACRGLVGGPPATDSFEAASATPDAEDWPFDLARVRLLHGEHLRRIGRPKSAREPLRAALDTFEHLDARPWGTRAARGLRATGLPVEPRWAVPRATVSPDEQRLADLAAAGLSNRQIADRLFVSRGTVSARLSALYTRLGITNRSALAGVLPAGPDRAA